MRVLFMQHDAFSPPRLLSERFAELGFEVVEELIVESTHYDTPGTVTYDFPDPKSVDVIVLRVEGVGIGARMCATVSHVGLARSFAAVAARRLSGANAMADYRQQ